MVKAKGKRGGARPGGGRPKGVKNRSTIEREINAAQVIDRARKEGRDLAVTVLERLMNVAEGAAGLNRPPASGKGGNWDLFGEWFDRTAYCAKALADYQSPKLRAVHVFAQPAPEAIQRQDGGNVVTLDDPVALARVYANTVKRIA
jgi:hypothetical protein